MAGRNATISVKIEGDADFGAARREAKAAIDDIEETADDIKLSAEMDTSSIQQAISLAKTLDGLTAELTIDSDISEIVEAEKLARSLRGFQARVDLSVAGKAELTEALNLSEQMDRLRTVRLEVQGRQDLERAAEIADDLERRRSVPIDAQASDLVRLDDQIGDAITDGGEAGAEGVAGALAGIDYADIGSSAQDQLLGSLAAAGPWAAVAGGIGAVFGDEFMAGFNDALPAARADAIRALKFNLSDADMAEIGTSAGEIYASGLGAGLTKTELRDAVATVKAELGSIDDDLDLTQVTKEALLLADTIGVDLNDAISTADSLVSRGLVRNTSEGLNLLLELAQETGIEFDEMQELVNEFGGDVRALGIDANQGFGIMAELFERKITPQLDQAGEIFSELNETIITGGAAEALANIGFNAESMQETIAKGGPRAAEAVAEIAKQILLLPSAADRASATTEIFGGNLGLMGDEARDATLELFATADQVGATGTALTDSVGAIEETATGLDRLKIVASDLGEELGTTVADGLDTLNQLANADFSDAAESAAGFGEALAERIAGPLATIAEQVGLDPFGPLKDSFNELTGRADELPPKLATNIEKLDETSEATENLSGGLYAAAAAVDELEAEFQGLFDFSADQLLRTVAEAGDDLAEALKNGGAEAVGMGGAIDISTEAGRKLQAQMEDVNEILVDLAVAYANNEITADQYAQATGELTGALSSNGAEANVTKDKVEGLRQKYLDVEGIDSIRTDFEANTERALNNVTALSRAIANIQNKSVTISASISGPTGISASGSIARRAGGGDTQGLTLVGEEGPELVDFKGRAFVYTAGQTREILSNQSDPGGRSPVVAGAGRPQIYIDKWVVDPGRDSWQDLQLAQLVYG